MKQRLSILFAMVAATVITALAQSSLVADGTIRIPRTPKDETVLPSPEASAMLRHASLPVSYNTGGISLSCPIYEVRSVALSQPISITYASNGIKVDDDNCLIGLGWTLNSGGYVCRTVKARPDEPSKFRGFNLEMENWISRNNKVDYLKSVLHGRTETEYDRYSFSVGGYSGNFILEGNYVKQMPRTDVKIELVGETREGVRDFRITTPDGTRYWFTAREHTDYSYNPASITVITDAIPPDYTAVTGWLLTKAVNGNDSITYEYSTTRQARIDVTDNLNSVSMSCTGNQYSFGGSYTNIRSTAKVEYPDKRVPKSISWRGGKVLFSTDSLGRYRRITGMSVLNASGMTVRSVSFDGSRFSDGRIRLDSYRIESGGRLLDGRSFGYHNTANDRRCKDYFGYSNQALRVFDSVLDSNLEPSPAMAYDYLSAEGGMLSIVTDATGAETRVDYEPNTAQCGDITVHIGVRVRRITVSDPITRRRSERGFEYAEAKSTIDFRSLSASDYLSTSGSRSGSLTSSSLSTGTTFTASCRVPGASAEGATIYYGKVTETQGGTGIEHPVRTVYRYDLTDISHPFVYKFNGLPSGAETNVKYIGSKAYATGGNAQTRLYILSAHPVKGYFKETLWEKAPLKRRTVEVWRNGAYEAETDETHHYTLHRDMSTTVGLFVEGLTRTAMSYNTVEVREIFDNVSDLNFFNVKVQSGRLLRDSTITVRRYPDGTRRRTVTRYGYNGLSVLLNPIEPESLAGEIVLPDSLLKPLLTLDMKGFTGCDTIRYDSSHDFPQWEEVECGGRKVGLYRCYASNIQRGFFSGISRDGYSSLPVIERYVVDGRDTVDVVTAYSRYGTAGNVRRSSVSIVHNGTVTSRRDFHAYDRFGNLAETSDNGGTVTSYLWGYGGTLPVASVAGGGYLSFASAAAASAIEEAAKEPGADLAGIISSIRGIDTLQVTSYTHIPLIGCSSVTKPDLLGITYAYSGGRLSAEFDADGNRVKSYGYTLREESSDGGNTTSETVYRSADGSSHSMKTVHYDGFGLPVAASDSETTPGRGNISKATRYDALGRTLAETVAAPFTISGNADSRTYGDILAAATAFHGDSVAERRISYEGTATATATGVQESGEAFAGHPATTALHASSTTDPLLRCIRYTAENSVSENMTVRHSGLYADGELEVAETTDEDGRRTLTFTDPLGNVVLVRRIGDAGTMLDTRNVYSPSGLLLAVLPPAVSDPARNGESVRDDDMSRYAYLYRYDSRDLLTGRRLPGCEWERYAYDCTGRKVFSQDGNLRQEGRWQISLHDAFGRRCVTGHCRWNGDSEGLSRTRVTAVRSVNGSLMGYEAVCEGGSLSLQGIEISAVDYHDDYSFLGHNGLPAENDPKVAYRHEEGYGDRYAASAKGMLTGTVRLARITVEAPADAYLYTVNYYDRRNRLIQTRSLNALHGNDESHAAYDFAGLPTAQRAVVRRAGGDGQSQIADVETLCSYDAAGRLTGASLRRVGGDAALARNTYDGLGRLRNAVLGNGAVGIDYEYNLRGWSTSVTSNVFNQLIHFQDPPDGGTPCFNGNISAIVWDQVATGNAVARHGEYRYAYDGLDRLTAANYTGIDNCNHSCLYAYDRMGNATSIKRYGITDRIDLGGSTSCSYGVIDDVTLTYNGNRLVCADDAADALVYAGAMDFHDGANEQTEYAYDANGNLTKDLNRGIESITYDRNNMPTEITFASGARTCYTYDADGRKLRVSHYGSRGEKRDELDYIGDMVLRNGALERILTPSGYIENDTIYTYVKDYQGNVRSVVREDGAVVESNEYYPYGGLFSATPSVQPYKYGAKELDRTHGLDWYDSKARFYDSILLRTNSVDKKAGDYTWLSPYLWCAANPIRFTDPTGMFTIENMSTFGNYPLILFFPSKESADEALRFDYTAASESQMPIVLVDDVSDFCDAMKEIGEMNISNTKIAINSHGSEGSFFIGNEKISNDTDFSELSKVLSEKTIFIGACDTGKGESGKSFIENFSKKTNSTVIGSMHKIKAGYKYNGDKSLNSLDPIPYKFEESNRYIISSKGIQTTAITDFRMSKKDFFWNEKFCMPIIFKHK